jgi:hypothetical protein
MANATRALLSPSQLLVDITVKLSSNSNYLLRLDLIYGRRDVSRVEAHYDVPPTSVRIVLGSISGSWQSKILASRGERLTTQAHRPCDFPTRVGRVNAREDTGAATRATILAGTHCHRRRAADYDRGL